MIFFTADEAKGNSQWDLQGPEGQLSPERWKTVSGLQAWYMMKGHVCKLKNNNNNNNIDLWNVTFTNLPPSLPTEREQISLKVLQTLGSDKVQVRVYLNSTCCWKKKKKVLTTTLFLYSSVRRSGHQVRQEGFQASPSPTAPHQHVRRPGGQHQDQTETWLLSATRWPLMPVIIRG